MEEDTLNPVKVWALVPPYKELFDPKADMYSPNKD